jgi:hypothetical protein
MRDRSARRRRRAYRSSLTVRNLRCTPFFDESGTLEAGGYICLGGFVIREDKLPPFNDAWNFALGEAPSTCLWLQLHPGRGSRGPARRPALAREFLHRGGEARLMTVRPPLLDDAWLGTAISEQSLAALERLGIDPCGEFGEFHTVVTHCPLFRVSASARTWRTGDERPMLGDRFHAVSCCAARSARHCPEGRSKQLTSGLVSPFNTTGASL